MCTGTPHTVWKCFIYLHVEIKWELITCLGTQNNPCTLKCMSTKMTEQTINKWCCRKQCSLHNNDRLLTNSNILITVGPDNHRPHAAPPACVCCQGDCKWALTAYNYIHDGENKKLMPLSMKQDASRATPYWVTLTAEVIKTQRCWKFPQWTLF